MAVSKTISECVFETAMIPRQQQKYLKIILEKVYRL